MIVLPVCGNVEDERQGRKRWRLEEFPIPWGVVNVEPIHREVRRYVWKRLGGRSIEIEYLGVGPKGLAIIEGTAIPPTKERIERVRVAGERLRAWQHRRQMVSEAEIARRLGTSISMLRAELSDGTRFHFLSAYPEEWGDRDQRGRYRLGRVLDWADSINGRTSLDRIAARVELRKKLRDDRRKAERQALLRMQPCGPRHRDVMDAIAWSQPSGDGGYALSRIRTERDRDRARPTMDAGPYVLSSSVRHSTNMRRWEGLSR